MEKKQSDENKTKRNYSRRSFLGLPTTIWMNNDLYIIFVNPSQTIISEHKNQSFSYAMEKL